MKYSCIKKSNCKKSGDNERFCKYDQFFGSIFKIVFYGFEVQDDMQDTRDSKNYHKYIMKRYIIHFAKTENSPVYHHSKSPKGRNEHHDTANNHDEKRIQQN